jgi:tight adherence protein B
MTWLENAMRGNTVALSVFALTAALLAVLLLSVIMIEVSLGRRNRERRIKRSVLRVPALTNLPKNAPSVRLQLGTSKFTSIDVLIRRLVPNLDKFRTRLQRTGHNIQIDYFLVACVLFGLFCGEVSKVFFGLSLKAAIPIGIAAGLLIPNFVVGYMGRRRLKNLLEQFPDTIDMIVRAVRSGLPVSEAIKVIADQVRPPIGPEFQRVVDAMKLGSTLDEALEAAAERIELAEFRFFIIALSIQQDTGGNLGETLENLSKMLRRRRAMKMKIRAVTAEARASASVLGSMPFVMFFLLMALNPEYEGAMINDTRGITMCVVGVVMAAIGIGIMLKLAKFQI